MLFFAIAFVLFCSCSSAELVNDTAEWWLDAFPFSCLDKDRNCYHATSDCLGSLIPLVYDKKTTVTNAQCISNCTSFSFSPSSLGPTCFYNASIDLANADRSLLNDGGPVTINERCYRTCPEDECYDEANKCYHTDRLGCNNWDSDAALEDKTTAVDNTRCIPYFEYRSYAHPYYRYRVEQTIKRAYPNWPNNRCRNTDFHRGGPWCYINDSKGNPMWANCYRSCSDHEMNEMMDEQLKCKTRVGSSCEQEMDPTAIWGSLH